MAQNLVINGVTYNSVNSLSIPKSGGDNAVFPDTSDATATAGDIADGKTAYVNGSKVTGTAAGGGSAPTIENASIQYASIRFYQPSNLFGTCNLSNIQFSGCTIEYACFSNISLENCSFAQSYLNNVSFEGATIEGETGTSADNIVLYSYMNTCSGSITLPSGATYPV